MFEIPGRIDEAAKLVEPINAKLNEVADLFSEVARRRVGLADEVGIVKAAVFLQECDKADIAELVAHQKELAALTDAQNVLPTCVKFFEAEIAAAEVGLSKARKAADSQLRKAGCGPELQPDFAANVEAAINRYEMLLRNCESVRTTQANLDDATNALRVFNRMLHDLPETLAGKRAALEQWARKRIFR